MPDLEFQGYSYFNMPFEHDEFTDSGVMGNPVAQRAMRLVSEGAGACAIKLRGVEGAEGRRVRALVLRGEIDERSSGKAGGRGPLSRQWQRFGKAAAHGAQA